MSDPVRAALELASALAGDAAQFGTHPAAAGYMKKWSEKTAAACQAALAALDREREDRYPAGWRPAETIETKWPHK